MKRTVHKKVKLNGEIYWLTSSSIPMYRYNISPLYHYDDDGNLMADFNDTGYAIVAHTGEIMRHRQCIGQLSDLEDA